MALAAATAYDIRKAVQALQATRLGQLQVSQIPQSTMLLKMKMLPTMVSAKTVMAKVVARVRVIHFRLPSFDDAHDCLPPPE